MRPSAQGYSFMWEIVKTIHEALHIEQTWIFVTAIGLIFAALGGGSAWLVDRAYKNSPQYRQEHAIARLSDCQPGTGICLVNGSDENEVSGNKDYRSGSTGVTASNSKRNRITGNELLPESSAPQTDPLIEEFKRRLIIHAGMRDKVRQDCRWFREAIKGRWSPYSPSQQTTLSKNLDDALSVIIAKANDKKALSSLADTIQGTNATP